MADKNIVLLGAVYGKNRQELADRLRQFANEIITGKGELIYGEHSRYIHLDMVINANVNSRNDLLEILFREYGHND